jgi:outer membrane receptor protein involved in Fe transport
MRNSVLKSCVSAIAIGLASISTSVFAQDAAPNEPRDSDQTEIIVTAQAKGQTRLKSSISVSSVNSEDLTNLAPRSSSELLRNIPGIRSESSGGESNANVSFRGLPVASGGAKFVQFHEDGVPVLEFGDILFGTADSYVKADATVERVEVVRGGSASTFASNSPGGVINFISKTGRKEGGIIAISRGIGYNNTRLDFNYGGPVSDSLRFNVGGYYRIGDGARNAGFRAENGGQIKANITKDFESGYVRLFLKLLDDKSPSYLPVPANVTGTGSNAKFSSVPGFDLRSGSYLSSLNPNTTGIGADGNRFNNSISEGFSAKSREIGAEFSFDIANDWKIKDRIKYAQNRGGFIAPLVDTINTTVGTAANNGGGTFTYANGSSAGQAYTGLVSNILLFNTPLQSLDNITNDLKIERSFDAGNDTKINLTVGYYKSKQDVKQIWNWTRYFSETSGENAALLNLTNAAGVPQTDNGVFNFSAVQRSWDISYDTDAPYAALGYEGDKLNVDVSIRYDFGRAAGTYGATNANPAVGRDINGNGVISAAEGRFNPLDTTKLSLVNYKYNYLSWSLGANYSITDNSSVFIRASRGGRANADRLVFGNINALGNVIGGKAIAVNNVNQYEAGVKYIDGGLRLFGTAFLAYTAETNFDPTRPSGSQSIDKRYRSYGLELEGSYRSGGFALTAGGTYTNSRITSDVPTPTKPNGDKGKTPQRQADFVYQATASYEAGGFLLGVGLNGTTSSFASDDNTLKQPGFVQVNAFGGYEFTKGLSIGVNANNLFNVIGITEVGRTPSADNSTYTARSINGRTVSATLKYSF